MRSRNQWPSNRSEGESPSTLTFFRPLTLLSAFIYASSSQKVTSSKVEMDKELIFCSRRSPVVCLHGCAASSQSLATSIGLGESAVVEELLSWVFWSTMKIIGRSIQEKKTDEVYLAEKPGEAFYLHRFFFLHDWSWQNIWLVYFYLDARVYF